MGEKHYTTLVVDVWMNMENWWNDTDRGKLKCLEEHLSQCHFLYHKSQMDWPETEILLISLSVKGYFHTRGAMRYLAIMLSTKPPINFGSTFYHVMIQGV
jgi:hypothetical protein